MTRVARVVQAGACLVVLLCFAGFGALVFATAGPPATAVEGGLVLLVLATPALLATWVTVGAASGRVARGPQRRHRRPPMPQASWSPSP